MLILPNKKEKQVVANLKNVSEIQIQYYVFNEVIVGKLN